MHDNIERVQHDFGSDANVIQVNHNAIDELNIQKIDVHSAVGLNIQTLSTANSSTNRQPLDTQEVTQAHPQWISGRTDKDNKQKLVAHASARSTVPVGAASVVANFQDVDGVGVEVNRQVLEASPANSHLEFLPTEERVKNLFEDIEVLTQQLDDFEARHKKILLAGQQARLRQQAQKRAASESIDPALSPLPPEEVFASSAVASRAVSLNIQSVGIDAFQQHRERPSTTECLADAQVSPHGPGSAVTQVLCLRWDWRAYLKMATTFVILSCWTCNIAAIHLEHKKIATGKLVRLVEFSDLLRP